MGDFFSFFSNIFGYILNFIYQFVQNYGVAIILFSVLLKVVLLPISIKQQKTMKKTAEVQEKIKKIQDKYKSDPEKLNREMMDFYKRENVSPFSGCLSTIIQMILLLSMFFLVKSPLTYMKKVDQNLINNYATEMKKNQGDTVVSTAYPEISIIKDVSQNQNKDNELYINMNFIGLDLSNVPKENYKDWTVYIIPLLYVISSIISMKITTNTNKSKKQDIVIENKDIEGKDEPDMATQMNKNMFLMMPLMSVMISMVAPLGLALYWLVNNILMTVERLILNKILDSREEKKNDK